jgi:small subunit ribosomal protein S16
MAVHIRLSRGGSKKAPFYRLLVTDQRSPREGRFLENVGTFDPCRKEGVLTVDLDRVNYWVSVGAKPSDTITGLLRKHAKTAAAAAPADASAKPAKKK